MAKKNVTFTVEETIAEKFKAEFENQSKKIEELMENSVVEGNEIEELENKLEEIQNEMEHLSTKEKSIRDKIQKLKEGIEKEELINNFVEDRVKTFNEGYPERWENFEQYWNQFGIGIMKKAENQDVNFDSVDLKLKIKEEIENRI